MSHSNGKTEKRPAPATAPGATTTMAVVQPTQAGAKDQNQGRGGLYAVVNGVRQRVHGTEHAPVKKDKTA